MKHILRIFDKNKFANVVTSVETWVQYYESQGKVRNKIWATKSTKRKVPCTARRSMSVQKVLYAIFSLHNALQFRLMCHIVEVSQILS